MSLCLILVLLIFPESATQAAADAIRIWGLDVVPSLFPYMVLSRTLASSLRARRIPVDVSAWLLGILGGSPSGAAALAAYAGDIQRQKLLALCTLTGCISPMFLMHTVALWAGNALFGKLLLAAHLIGAILAYVFVACCLRAPVHSPARSGAEREQGDNPIAESVSAVLNVGGCIVFFSVMAAACARLLPFLTDGQRAVIQGIMEASGGLHALLASSLPKGLKYVLCAGIAGFSGLSILFQNFFFLKPLGVPFRALLLFGALRALISSGAMLLLLMIFT